MQFILRVTQISVPNFMATYPVVPKIFHSTHGGPREKGRGSPKSVGLILWGLCIYIQHFMATHPVAVEIFSLDQSGGPIDSAVSKTTLLL